MLPPRRRRRGRKLLWVAAVVVALPLAGYAGLNLLLSSDVLRPRLIAAVQQGTGKTLTLGGPVGVKLSLVPTITLDTVSLADEPGGEPLLEAKRIEAELALIPLLSRQIALHRLTVIEPVLRVTTGQPAKPPRPSEGSANAAPREPVQPLALAIDAIDLEKGRLIWRNAATGQSQVIEIEHLALTDKEPNGPANLTGKIRQEGYAVDISAETGALSRLLPGAPVGDSWPLRVALQAEGVQAVLEGTLDMPEQLTGLRSKLHLTLDNSSRIRSLPGLANLPSEWIFPAEGLFATLDLRMGPDDAAPRLGALRIGAASLDLSRYRPGLGLSQLEISSPAPDAPLRLSAVPGPSSFAAHLGGEGPSLDQLSGQGPWPIRLSFEAPKARLDLHGELPGPTLTGARFDARLEAEDIASALGIAGLTMPPPPEGISPGAKGSGTFTLGDDAAVRLSDLSLETPFGDLAGEIAWHTGGRPALNATLTSTRFSFDSLSRISPAAPAQTSATPSRPAQAPATPARPPLPSGGQAQAPDSNPNRLIPALPVSLAPLRLLDSTFSWQVATLDAGGLSWQDAQLTAQLKDGVLKAEPFAVTMPGGRVSGRLGADASGDVPAFTLQLRHEGQGVDMAEFLPAIGVEDRFTGRLEIDADLQGKGADLRAIAASLAGHLGLASVNGSIDGRLVDRMTGDLRQLLPQGLGRNGLPLRCFALRLEGQDGSMRPRAMLLDANQVSVLGAGRIEMGDERLNLRLLPQIKVASIGVSAPVRVSGTFASPSYRLDEGGVGGAAAGIIGDLVGDAVGGLSNLLPSQSSRGGAPDCAQQLAVARGGRAGPAAPAERRSTSPLNRPQDMLRGLFGR
ncbi:AsmA family protein [Acetobacteraceae bacterium H6797]|nr:AsmA family protein [Acetobacteraceae bacterium H6797]